MVLEYMKKYKEEIKQCIDDLKHRETYKKQIPNLLTFSRAVFAPLISTLFLMGHPIWGIISTGLILSTDLFDGKLARKWNVQSKFGADLDAFCDKIMFLGLAVPLMVSNPLIILNFIFEGAISLVNVLGRMNGLDTKTVFSGKVKTCFLSLTLGVGYLVQFLNVPVSILNALVGITFASQGIAFVNYIKEYKRMSKEQLNGDVVILNADNDEEDMVEVYKKENSLVEQLRYERELILGMSEPDVVKNNKRCRNINQEEKNGNFIS